jgi:hypothetical protein
LFNEVVRHLCAQEGAFVFGEGRRWKRQLNGRRRRAA